MSSPRPGGLSRYYLIEALNAYGTNVFFLGVYFNARLIHGFSDTANLLLAATQGAAYVLATRGGGRLADRVGPDRSIAAGLCGMCLALLGGWLLPAGWALFAAIGLYSASTALTWPALEAAIARAPGPVPLPRRTGLYNVIWSSIGSVGFFAIGPLFLLDPDAVFWAPLAAHAIELAGLAALGLAAIRPFGKGGRSASESTSAEGWRGGEASVARTEGSTTEYRSDRTPERARGRTAAVPALPTEAQARYLLSARIANGLGYFLFGAFSALAPTLGERLGLDPRLAIWLVSSYLFARSGAFVLFWRWAGWEYRRSWLAAGLLLPPAAFAAVFLAGSPGVVVAALIALGALSGLAYSASLHASLECAGHEGEGGGLHEWVIGLGILLGPLAGASGTRLLAGVQGAGTLVTFLGAAVAIAGLVPLLRRSPGR